MHVCCGHLEYNVVDWVINSSKKVRKLKFDWRFLSCYQLIFLAFGIIGKPCYSSLQWCAICYDYAIWGRAAHLNMGVGVKWNVPKCIAIVITLTTPRSDLTRKRVPWGQTHSWVRLIWNPGKNDRNLSPKCLSDSDSGSVWLGFQVSLTWIPGRSDPKMGLAPSDSFPGQIWLIKIQIASYMFAVSIYLRDNNYCPYQHFQFLEYWHRTNWTQLDTIGFSWTFFQHILDLTGLDWTFSQLDKIGSNGHLLGNKIKSNQLSPTEFPIGLSWSKILFQLEIQYSNINQLTPTQYQLNPIHSYWISNWNESAILVRVGRILPLYTAPRHE